MSRNPNVWTEDKGRADDMLFGASLEEQDNVAEATVRHGKILLSNCTRCGRQVKAIVPWPEIADWYSGVQVPNSKPTKQGIVIAMGCQCGHASPLCVKWNEVADFVEEGVFTGALPPTMRRR